MDADFGGIDVHAEGRRHQFFVEWRVTNPSMIEGMKKVQERLLKVEPKLQVLQSCASDNIHVTMNQLELKDNSDLEKAIEVVKKFEENEFPKLAKGVTMKMRGFDHFNKRVLFAKVRGEKEGEGEKDPLLAIFELLQERFVEAGVLSLEKKKKAASFKAHLTICKAPAGKGKAVIPDSVFDEMKEMEGEIEGEQELDRLAFCVKRVKEEPTPPVLYEISLRR